MDAALVTVGDELLAGDTPNTNATWLAKQLSDRGVRVRRVVTVPDVVTVIAEYVGRYSDAFDAVIVTGGLGGTPDDVTMDGVAAAFGVGLEANAEARADVEETIAAYHQANPDREVRLDLTAEASIPTGARPILNPAGLSPGCVIENVYVLPGIPSEMEAMFGEVAAAFAGDVATRYLYTEEPESNLIEHLSAVGAEFAVTVGCYPDRAAGHNRLKLSGTDTETLDAAAAWLTERVETIPEPE